MKENFRISRKKLIIPILALILIGIGYVNIFVIGSYVNPASIDIKQVKIDDYQIKVSGLVVNGFQGYSGYKVMYKNKAVYLKIRYSVVSFFNPSGSFEINAAGYFEGASKAYLLGPNGETKLIWNR